MLWLLQSADVLKMRPGPGDWLFILGMFLGFNGAMLWWGRRRSRASRGIFRWLAWLPPLPLVGLMSWFCWQWTSDMTAANLWPLALVMWGVPCWLADRLLVRLERWTGAD